MAFLSASPIDHGLLDLGCHSLGGIAYRFDALPPDPLDSEGYPKTSGEKRFISEHNLALYWRRPGLFPTPFGLPMPILRAPRVKREVQFLDPMRTRADCSPFRYMGRNLLTGHIIDKDNSQPIVRLWSVDDQSARRTLRQMDVKCGGGGRNDDDELDERSLCVVEFHDGKDTKNNDEDDNDEESAPPMEMELPTETLELRKLQGSEDGGGSRVFARTKQSLLLIDCEQASVQTVINIPVQSFTQIPYMEREIAVVDSANFLFIGDLDVGPTSFARFKTSPNEEIKAICPTDCPRLLIAMCRKRLLLLDLRLPRDPGHLIFSHTPLAPANPCVGLHEDVYDHLSERDEFCHISQLDPALDAYLLTTTRKHIVVDSRLPGIPLLTMGHAEMGGADFSITTPPFIDQESGGGRVFSRFGLTHVRRPALSHWAFMYHPKEQLWSSLGPARSLPPPKLAIRRFVENRDLGGGAILDRNRLPGNTSAIHFQMLPNSPRRAILFRQMDSGDIWYDNFLFDAESLFEGEEEQSEFGERPDKHARIREEVAELDVQLKLQSLEHLREWIDARKCEDLRHKNRFRLHREIRVVEIPFLCAYQSPEEGETLAEATPETSENEDILFGDTFKNDFDAEEDGENGEDFGIGVLGEEALTSADGSEFHIIEPEPSDEDGEGEEEGKRKKMLTVLICSMWNRTDAFYRQQSRKKGDFSPDQDQEEMDFERAPMDSPPSSPSEFEWGAEREAKTPSTSFSKLRIAPSKTKKEEKMENFFDFEVDSDY